MQSWIGELSALATAALWAGTALVFTSAVGRVGAMQVNITRLVIATFLLAITVLARGVPAELSPRQMLLLVASGVVGLVFGDSFLFKAFELLGARLSMLVMALSPALAAIMAFLVLGETLTAVAVGGAVLTLAGIAIVVWEGPQAGAKAVRVSGLGVLCAFLGAFGQGANLVLARLAFNEGPIDGFVASLVRIGSSALLLAPVASWLGSYRDPIKAFAGDRHATLMILIGSVIGPYMGITLSLVAVAHAHVGIAATLMATTPIIMLPLSRIFGHERLTARAVTGALAAVGGVALLFLA